jgi:beta-aspartyl-peptidase (threonine type)
MNALIRFGFIATGFVLLTACQPGTEATSANEAAERAAPVAIVIHGGAGTITREAMTAERETAIRSALRQALEAGHAQLQAGADSIDAVIAAINVMEDAPEFNAGRGAVLNHEGFVELDASLMDGASGQAGAIAGASTQDGGIRYPIRAARAVMTDSPHVMLSGPGAESFAEAQGIEFIEPEWFITDFRRQQWEAAQADSAVGATAPTPGAPWYSTVGAVALDQAGNLAAGTSTGGMTNKRFGRIGDSPIIGAGTYADNDSCAVSATGHGEFFIRHVVAYDICARMRYQGASLEQAAESVINSVLVEAGGDGGVIAMDQNGQIAMPFNTEGMYRAAIDTDGQMTIAIYGDETARGLE